MNVLCSVILDEKYHYRINEIFLDRNIFEIFEKSWDIFYNYVGRLLFSNKNYVYELNFISQMYLRFYAIQDFNI